jgi:hypothetical protein
MQHTIHFFQYFYDNLLHIAFDMFTHTFTRVCGMMYLPSFTIFFTHSAYQTFLFPYFCNILKHLTYYKLLSTFYKTLQHAAH